MAEEQSIEILGISGRYALAEDIWKITSDWALDSSALRDGDIIQFSLILEKNKVIIMYSTYFS